MDRELIKMCDCPEIQDRWEPKGGDKVWENHDKQMGHVYGHKHGFWYTKTPEVILCDGKLGRYAKENLIYIPRIEDVLEWLVPKYFKTFLEAHYCLTECHIRFDIAIKQWLDMFMRLEQNKTWDGEAWHG